MLFSPQTVRTAYADDYPFTWPVDISYSITAGWTYSNGGYHGATDFGVSPGTPVYATASGTVIDGTIDYGCTGSHNAGYTPSCVYGSNCPAVKQSGRSTGSYSNKIVIDHGNGYCSYYCHLQTGSFQVKVGDHVQQGQQIACSGAAGNTMGAHLHFEIRKNGQNVDPQTLMTKVNVTSDPIPVPSPTSDYIVHLDRPTGTYNSKGNLEISGWVASKAQITFVMAQSDAIADGQMNLSGSMRDASAELNGAGYSAYPYKYRFGGVIPAEGIAENKTYSFSVWMGLASGGQTSMTTSVFRVGNGSDPLPEPSPGLEIDGNHSQLECIVHFDSPTGTYRNTDIEISGWIASLKPVGSCMVESDALPMKQENLSASLRDASAELDAAGYGEYPYKYRFSGVIPKSGMVSHVDYDVKAWFNFTDGSSSGVTKTSFHTAEMTNTEIVITSPKGGSNFPNTSNVPITGYILADSPLWYIMCQAGDQQYELEGIEDAALAAANECEYAYRFSKTIRCDTLPADSNPVIEVWTKNSGDGVELHEQVRFTTGARVYGSLDDFVSKLDLPVSGMTPSDDFEVTGWVTAHAPIGYVICQAVPTDGSEGGFQLNLDIEPTSELDSRYSEYEYRARYRGIIEYGMLKSNTTYKLDVWCGLVDSKGTGNQRILDGCGSTFSTGTVTTPVYTNSFDANGGTGAPAAVRKTWHQAIQLPTAVPTRLGYTFLGWNFSAEAYEAKYVPGADFNEETDHTLYAVWESAELIPVDTTKTEIAVTTSFGGQRSCYMLTPAESTVYRFAGTDKAEITVFDDQGESCGSGASVEANLTASQTYYVYAGYADAAETGEFTLTVTRAYPVTFDPNGGIGAPEGVYYQFHGEALVLPDMVPALNSTVTLDPNNGTTESSTVTTPARFLGWAVPGEEEERIVQSGESVIFNKDTRLVATWEYQPIGTIVTPIRSGYTFLSWTNYALPFFRIYLQNSSLHARFSCYTQRQSGLEGAFRL